MRAWWLVIAVGVVGGCSSVSKEGASAAECTDQIDNDANGFVDCDDAGCFSAPNCAGTSGTGEGTQPGQCTDGADNDADGFFDCDDSGCAGSPDCKSDGGGGGDTDAGGGGGGGGGGDTDIVVTGTGINERYKSMSLSYSVDIDWDANGMTNCVNYFDQSNGKSCKCTATYKGRGQLDLVNGPKNRYLGTWELVSSNCAIFSGSGALNGMSLNDASVYVPVDNVSYHTFLFTTDGTKGVRWVAHDSEDNDTPCMAPGCQSAIDLGHFWIVFNRPQPVIGTVSADLLDYTEHDNWFVAEALSTMILDHHLVVQFSESTTPPEYPPL